MVKELELLEISVVTIPCNPKAKFTTETTEPKKEEAKEDKSVQKTDIGLLNFIADAIKQLENVSDIDGEFLAEIEGIYQQSKKQ